MDIMNYGTGAGADENWIVEESRFDPHFLGKCESIFALGNGYMGQRAAAEERYLGETRNLFVAGTFNKFSEGEVTELPNAADLLWLDIRLNGRRFNLLDSKILGYKRFLHIKNAELVREARWEAPGGETFALRFRRFVSLADRHVVAMRMEITPLSGSARIAADSGINGRMTNSGSQHFAEGGARFYDGRVMQLAQKTTQSEIAFVYSSAHNFFIDEKPCSASGRICMDRRQIFFEFAEIEIGKGQTLVIEKISNVFTDRDNDIDVPDLDGLKLHSLEHLQKIAPRDESAYSALFEEHRKAWQEKVWDAAPIVVESRDPYDQLAIRFAQYHLAAMTPAHDNRMGVAAKGLSGEGYKGHSFWDTEIFVLPYFIYTMPEVARSLLEYRYNTLPGARRKASENGYEGAMFPWESAWIDDGEVTPLWGAADIVSGEPIKIWSGVIEQHITSDIAYAVWQYFQITRDADFMEKCGYEIIFDTAKFWVSRLEHDAEKDAYCINDVMGPDEYKEHINNNAFTNYMARWTISKAIEYFEHLEKTDNALLADLRDRLDLDRVRALWLERIDKIFLPQPGSGDMVIAQDDTYLAKKSIDLAKYKSQENVGSIYKDFNQEQINSIQVSKQADVIMLLHLLPDLFGEEVKRANWAYYEPRTLHDSSLSLSTHAIFAKEMGDLHLAYDLFSRAARIDLGPNMRTSDAGIHSASIGGIWQCVANGFGGVRMVAGELHVSPRLPEAWSALSFPIIWHGEKLTIDARKDRVSIARSGAAGDAISIWVNGEKRNLADKISVELRI